jgi:hypothetical protein
LGFRDGLLSSTLPRQCYLLLFRFAPGKGAPPKLLFVALRVWLIAIERRVTNNDEGVMLEDVSEYTILVLTGILVGDVDGSYNPLIA